MTSQTSLVHSKKVFSEESFDRKLQLPGLGAKQKRLKSRLSYRANWMLIHGWIE